jgi:hypothetical protein
MHVLAIQSFEEMHVFMNLNIEEMQIAYYT